jgi:[ribosomal protein S5]-alanine N-acetyltransferase
MNKLPTTDLESKHLLLVPLNESHIPAMFEYSSIPEFYEHMEGLPHKNIEETTKYFYRLMDFVEAGALYWAIIQKCNSKVIGTIGIRNINKDVSSGDIGMGLSPKYWNKGYSKESMFLAINYFFNTLDFKLITSLTSSKNLSSNKLIGFLGYQDYTVLKNHYKKHNGTEFDAIKAVLTRENFNISPVLSEYAKKWIYDK